MITDVDQRLRDLLAPGERSVDEPFAERVRQRVLADRRLRAARLLAWKRFAAELAASGAILLVLAAVVGLTPIDIPSASGAPIGPVASALSSSLSGRR